MVTSISSASATQATYAPTAKKNLDEPTVTTTALAPAEAGESAAATTQSAESAASARLGDQLNAQADASRVQRAVDESAVTDTEAETEATDTETEATAAQAPAGGAPPAGGSAPAASPETTATDYIAEADTNSDKTVSDEERAAYETKLRQQAEDAGTGATKSSVKTDPLEALTAEVRATYGVDEAAAPVLDITA